MNILNPERYHKLAANAQAAGFSGWDFSWLNGRMIQENPPWDYDRLVKEQLNKTHSLLDMGTGDGELLASLAPLPPDTHATEAYPPNQTIALERLSTLAVTVHAIKENTTLPFSNARFDLVINRHEDFDPEEVFRVLKPHGFFITQQVGGLDNLELNQVLEDNLSFPFVKWGLASALSRLYEANFHVVRAEKAALKTIFTDIGAVLYYLKAIPWQVVGFNPETHFPQLVRLHNIIERHVQFVTTAHRFLIVAQKRIDSHET